MVPNSSVPPSDASNTTPFPPFSTPLCPAAGVLPAGPAGGATGPGGRGSPSTTFPLSPASGSGGSPAPPPSPWSFRLIASPTARRQPPVGAATPQHGPAPWVGGGGGDGGGWLRVAPRAAGAGAKQGPGGEGGEAGGQRDLRSAAAAAMACRRLRHVYRQLLAARPELAMEVGVGAWV